MPRIAGWPQAGPPMPRAESSRLAVLAKADQAARDRLVEANLGLLVSTARRYRNTLGEDAFGEACVIFLESIDTFDPEVGDFIPWAICSLWMKLGWAARREGEYRARTTSLPPGLRADAGTMPDLLSMAHARGAITDRQARVLMGKAFGESREVTMELLRISERTYHRDLAVAVEAIRAYVR